MLVYNALRTPDGTVIESLHRHDYVTYDDANGKSYMVDGGLNYLRRSANGDEVDLSVSLDQGILAAREALSWGSNGKNGDEPLRLIKLCKMTNNHIKACLKTQFNMHPNIKLAMQQELDYRNKLGIVLEDV